MEKNIEIAKKIIDEQVEMGFINQTSPFLRTNKTYPWTNEDIERYLKFVDFNGKDSGLTVLASGDQAFNLVKNGIGNIDTFDINPLAEYYALGLKRAMILKYDFKTFNNVIEILYNPWCGIDMVHSLIKGLFPYMESEHKKFWETILDYSHNLQKSKGTRLNVILMLVLDVFNLNQIGLNNYLSNEDNYNLIRNGLSKANITFKNINAIDLARVYKGKKYDIIMMSNILDYFHEFLGENWTYNEFKNYRESLETLGKKDAYIFLHYIICYMRNGELYRDSIINKADILECDLKEEELRMLSYNAFIDNGIILSRVK